MKGFMKDKKFHPISNNKTRKSSEKKTIPDSVKLDTTRKKRILKWKDGDKINYNGKHSVLSTKLPDDRSGSGSSVIFPIPSDEKITYVISKSDGDGHIFYHWENGKGQSIAWTGNEAGYAQSELARRTSALAFRTDYREGLQFNLSPNEFDGVSKTWKDSWGIRNSIR